MNKMTAGILALGIFAGLVGLGITIERAVAYAKSWDRVVTVKGLSEREVLADRVIWPVQFSVADNQLTKLNKTLTEHTSRIKAFMEGAGIQTDSIIVGQPQITDKLAQQYGNASDVPFRYNSVRTITVISDNVSHIINVMDRIGELVSDGIMITGEQYATRPEFVFTGLNDIKPAMIEEATVNARQVAEKFAGDSDSTLGKIKRASQGQFSIVNRDAYSPHIKKVRVVSTIEYTLVD